MLGPLQIIGTAISAYSTIQGGRAARADANRQAALYEREKQLNKLETLQRHNDRLNQYDAALATNTAWFSFLGRDASDRSVRAFLDKQKEVAYTDITRSELQGFIEGERLGMQADLVRTRGRNQQRASQLSALSSITSGLFRYQQIKGV
jgi:hypothetical protein|tara:strand:+ start:6170 stop:6616 length:447 start_codon:yes stop_codon:yes gene_type:complete